MEKEKCDVCNGTGSADFHYNGDEPIIETEPCEDCEGEK